VETNWLASARARLGLAYGCFLLYGTGGAAFGEVDVTANDTASSTFFYLNFPLFGQTNVNKSRDQDTRVGWTGGGGLEWMLRHSLSLGLEYRHTDLGSESHHFESRQAIIFPSHMDVDFQNDQVTFKVNFLFHEFLHR
jgi:outer membrane immunogenic protein